MAFLATSADQQPLVLIVPGLDNSGPGHWQTIWEQEREDCARVELGAWNAPNRNRWVTQLSHAINGAGRPVVLAAHSLGCLAVVWWAALERPAWQEKVIGALLVAPPEVDAASTEARISGFGPVPKGLLPFPSIVVASRNDPYIRFERAQMLARFWGGDFVDAGEAGHLNTHSGLGAWQFGQTLLGNLSQSATQRATQPAGSLPGSTALSPEAMAI